MAASTGATIHSTLCDQARSIAGITARGRRPPRSDGARPVLVVVNDREWSSTARVPGEAEVTHHNDDGERHAKLKGS